MCAKKHFNSLIITPYKVLFFQVKTVNIFLISPQKNRYYGYQGTSDKYPQPVFVEILEKYFSDTTSFLELCQMLCVYTGCSCLTDTINVLKFQTPKCLTKWHMQPVQTQIRLLLKESLIRVYTVCHLLSILRSKRIKSKIQAKIVWNNVFEILGP